MTDSRPRTRPSFASIGNRFVLAVLRSRLHRMFSGSLMILRLVGRKSGVELEFPVMYATDDESVVVVSARASTKRWWRNLVAATPVRLRIAGRERRGVARSVEGDVHARGRALRLYLDRFPKAASALGVAPATLETVHEEVLGAAEGDFVVVRIDLASE